MAHRPRQGWSVHAPHQAYDPEGTNPRVLAGWASVHNKDKEDRQFKMRTCEITGIGSVRIVRGPLEVVNRYDGELKDITAKEEFYVGMYSRHNNDKEDRQFGFMKVVFCKA